MKRRSQKEVKKRSQKLVKMGVVTPDYRVAEIRHLVFFLNPVIIGEK